MVDLSFKTPYLYHYNTTYILRQVLIIDDEIKLRTLLARIITMEGFEVFQAGTAKLAWQKLEQTPSIQVILCDVKLPDANGVELAQKIKDTYPQKQIILLTAFGNIPDSVQAIKNGAFNYLTKGDDNNRILPLLYDAFQQLPITNGPHEPKGIDAAFQAICANSVAMQNAIQMAKKVATAETSVLLTGETGTGKEVFAKAIHQASKRALQAMVSINCSAFSKELLETEMFGHKQGAFTGAITNHIGVFEQAHNGTLFLDELGEMPLELQAKLLRVLENGEFIKVGDNKPTQVNVRVIAATHKNLENEIKLGQFREDLFYRISVFQIQLPTLKNRTEDILPLANSFLQLFLQRMGKHDIQFSEQTNTAIINYHWPGNVRELKNTVERAVVLTSNHEQIEVSTFPPHIAVPNHVLQENNSSLQLANAEKIHIIKVLQHTHGNKTKAAELLNIAVTTLYRKMSEYSIDG